MAGDAVHDTHGVRRALVLVKLVHTLVWAFLAGCILALPIAGWMRRFDWALILTAIILIECGLLALNRGKCPLTTIAERYTKDRTATSDIYLPHWLASRNKVIFGTLFLIDLVVVLCFWRL